MNDLLNSLKEINWAISLLAGIPLAVFANLITPKVANYLSRISKKRNHKRTSKIKSELEEVELLLKYPEKINLETAISIFKVLLIFGFASLLAAIPLMEIITGPLAALCFLYAVDTTVE
jgi:predicted RND superfamily exporter protein